MLVFPIVLPGQYKASPPDIGQKDYNANANKDAHNNRIPSSAGFDHADEVVDPWHGVDYLHHSSVNARKRGSLPCKFRASFVCLRDDVVGHAM